MKNTKPAFINMKVSQAFWKTTVPGFISFNAFSTGFTNG